ncbi:MAG: hypothetical protein GY789_22765 [Hyphomicrobiales bacterium]|nr:hypothetical protein [Hyphomicrobiales bacterium]
MAGASEEKSTDAKAVKLPENLTPETIRQLVSTLNDQQVRQLLFERLDAVAKNDETKQKEGTKIVDFLMNSAVAVGISIKNSATEMPQIIAGVRQSFSDYYKPRGISGVLVMLATMGLAIAIGLIVELIVTRFAQKWREQIESTKSPKNLREALEVLGKRLVLELVGLFAFFAVTRIFIEILVPENDRPLMPLLMINLVVIPRLFVAISRFVLAPNRPSLRLVHTDDWTAHFLFRNQLGIILLAGFSVVIIEFQHPYNVSAGDAKIGFWLGIAAIFWVIYVVYRARHGLTSILIGAEDDATPLERLMAKAYPWVAIALIIVTWLLVEIIVAQGRFDLVADGEQYLTVGILLAAPVLDTIVRGIVKHLAPPMRGEGILAEAAYQSTKRSYIRIGRALVNTAVIVVIVDVWNVDFTNLAHAGLGARIAASLFEIIFILAIGYLVWEIVSLWLNRKLADEQLPPASTPEPKKSVGKVVVQAVPGCRPFCRWSSWLLKCQLSQSRC